MNTARRIARNSGFLFVGDAASSLMGILLIVLLARNLGAAELGKYSFAISFTSLFLVLADMGLSVITIREIARSPGMSGEYLTTVSIIKLALSAVMLGVIAAGVHLLGYPKDTITLVYIFGAINALGSFTVFLRSIFRAFEQMKYDALTRVAERLLVVATALIVLVQSRDLKMVALAMLMTQTAGFLLTLLVCLKKFARPRLAFDYRFALGLLLAASPLALATILDNVILQTDTVMLSKMKGDAVVGLYSAAYRPVQGMLFLPTIFVYSIFPVLSRLHVTDRQNLGVLYRRSLKFMVTLSLPFGLGTTVIADRLILLLYGDGFAGSVIALRILAWTVSLFFITTFTGHVLVSTNRQGVAMRISAIGALLNVVLNFALIPTLDYAGAAIASVISQVVVFVLEFGYLQRYVCEVKLFQMAGRPMVAAVAMGSAVYVTGRVLAVTAVNLSAMIAMAIATYALVLYLLKGLDQDELAFLKGLLTRRPAAADKQ